MKQRVLNWIEQGCDYQTGILLLVDSGRHRQLIKSISGRPHRYSTKLLYELCKEAQIPFIDLGQADVTIISKHFHAQADPNPDADNGQADSCNDSTGLSTNYPDDLPDTDFSNLPAHLRTQSTADFNQLPPDLLKVIREHSKLFLLRSQLHEQMAALPEDNQPDTVKKRKNLSDSIALLSPRIDLLFQAKEDFYTKNLVPNLATLFPEPPPVSDPTSEETPLPSSANELKKLKKNLQTANTKDQNLLQYQDEKKAAKPCPMPSGPKRLKLEKRITARSMQIEAIDYKLLP